MPKRPALSSREIEQILRKKDFIFTHQRGSHQYWTGFIKGKKRRVTLIANQKDFHPDTMKSMIRQSGLTEEEFYQLYE
ncbi:MAG: type II toxin-antitoxin system HicA family toxin [bacterium]|nr:type II toxin-antitoxin system HicA family toxin [bacterium]